jgi:dTDP-4-amino-4,6-dideoxygalactose transaminase
MILFPLKEKAPIFPKVPVCFSFEKEFAKTVGSKFAIATVNGTAALHISLLLADVKKDDEVITQPLTFSCIFY